MQAYIAGNQQAHHILYSRHKERIWQYFYRRVRADESLTADLFQEAFLKLHRSRESFRAGAKFLPWFYTICHNLLVDYLRKRRPELIGQDIEILPSQAQKFDEKNESIDLSEIEKLSAQEQRVIKLKFEKDLNYKEVAQTMGIGQANARQIFSRGLKKLKELLGGQL